jgi:hypothetical protein
MPVENATITIPAEGMYALSDDHGNFTIANVPPGIITIYVIHRHHQKYETDIHLNDDMFVDISLT